MRIHRLLAGLAISAFIAAGGVAHAAPPADLVIDDANIYTADANHTYARSMAIQDGRIVFIGAERDVQAFIGPATKVVRAKGQLVLPGLVDSHIHPIWALTGSDCDLASRPMALAAISAAVKKCITDGKIPPGQWVTVAHWEMSAGNAPDAAHPDLRAALDAASTVHPIEIVGWDIHHGGFNSAGLALARDKQNKVVGYSKATLAGEFGDLSTYIGTRSDGEPNGLVSDRGKEPIDRGNAQSQRAHALVGHAEDLAHFLNAKGLTAIRDAAATSDAQLVYDALLASGKFTLRANLAQFLEPEKFEERGKVDYDKLFAAADAVRAKYAGNPLIKADTIKIFADGIIESDPTTVPPTLGNAPRLEPYQQPIFQRRPDGHLAILGYVDPASPQCTYARARPGEFSDAGARARFVSRWGFDPGQCAISYGVPQHDPAIFYDYVREAHLRDYTVHIHAIGDGAVRMAVDALEKARALDGKSDRADGLAHVEFAHPDDIARAGRNHLSITWTFAWMYSEPDGFDLSVAPFYNKVKGTSYAELNAVNSAFSRDYYPVKSAEAAGVLTSGGSDAPVLTADPQPFLNLERAVTRSKRGLQPINPWQRLTIEDAIAAYTINGARALGREKEIGSLEVGKSADFIFVSQDILALAKVGQAQKIADTSVLSTWFRGEKVYEAPDAR